MSFTYPEVGATREGPLPKGYRYLRYRTLLGRAESRPAAEAMMGTAAEAILTWRLHRSAGVRVRASAPRAAPGVAVTCAIGVGPLRMSAPCEVVWVLADDDRAGFGYGTLPGHPARGEESFVVVRDADGKVWFEVTSFSLPARWFMRLAGPAAPLMQRLYARRLGQVLARLCR
jgi:uncharacterized protein (UPF0548 family)